VPEYFARCTFRLANACQSILATLDSPNLDTLDPSLSLLNATGFKVAFAFKFTGLSAAPLAAILDRRTPFADSFNNSLEVVGCPLQVPVVDDTEIGLSILAAKQQLFAIWRILWK